MDEDEDEILIGEGVRLSHGSAPVSLRMFSAIIDALATTIVAYTLFRILGGAIGGLNDAQVRTLAVLTFVFAFVAIPALVETLTRGLSLGRLAVGLRIVRDDGGPIAARHAVLRAFAGLLEIYGTLGTLAFVVAMFSRRGKRIGDFLAGTYALRTRVRIRPLRPLAMPDRLAAWAATADIVRLPDGLALSCRLYLERRSQLSPRSDERLAERLTDRLLPLVAPPPPPGATRQEFIAAVIVERRNREYDIGAKAAERVAAERRLVERLPYGIADGVD